MANQTPETPAVGSKEFLTDMAKGGPLAAVVAFLGWFLTSQMENVAIDIADLRDEIKTMQVAAAGGMADRWTSSDQRVYSREIDGEIRELQRRIEDIEKRSPQ